MIEVNLTLSGFMDTLACIFSTNIFSLGLFLPISAGVLILINLVFGAFMLKKLREEKKLKSESLSKKIDS